MEIVANCLPLFNYGQVAGTWDYDGDGYRSMTIAAPEDGPELTLTSSIGLGLLGQRCYGRTTLEEGQSSFVAPVVERFDPWPPSKRRTSDLATTVEYWRNWLSTGTFPDHPWRHYIERSALTLKGLSYAPTGAVMAASTTSLPETPGGARNWDYRYTWIRDSSFMLRSLYRLGFDWEALEYFGFVLEAVTGGDANQPFRAADHVRHRWGAGPDRADARPPLRLPGIATGAGRQRRLEPAPE